MDVVKVFCNLGYKKSGNLKKG